MKKLILVLLMATALTACSRVPAGNVGVKYYLLGTEKGVDSEELGPGRYWIGYNEELYLFPTFTQNYVWTKDSTEGSMDDESISFQDRDGLEISVDVGISYRIKPEKVSTVFEKYRRGIDEITDTYLRNMVRDSFVKIAGTLPAEAIYGEGKGALIEKVQEDVQRQVEDIGIIIEKIYWIGSARLPEVVIGAINEKINANQKALTRQNELNQTIAEANKIREAARGEADAAKIRAEGEAEANRIISNSINETIIRYELAKKWDGVAPKVYGTEGAAPFFDIGKLVEGNK